MTPFGSVGGISEHEVYVPQTEYCQPPATWTSSATTISCEAGGAARAALEKARARKARRVRRVIMEETGGARCVTVVTLCHSSARSSRLPKKGSTGNLTTDHHEGQGILLLRHPNRQCWHLRRHPRTARFGSRGRHPLRRYFVEYVPADVLPRSLPKLTLFRSRRCCNARCGQMDLRHSLLYRGRSPSVGSRRRFEGEQTVDP
jgi:hypothetical protein